MQRTAAFLTKKGYDIGYNPNGPTDRRVPVLQATAPDRQLLAVLFGYGCHNTTVGPANYEISGDYVGFAQAELERAHPGATAMFLQLCAGDQDPHPRGGLDVAERNGKELASAVEQVLNGKLPILRGPIHTAFQTVELALAPQNPGDFREASQRFESCDGAQRPRHA